MNENPNISELPSRRSLRLATYDYSSTGAYSITLCTQNRQSLLENPRLREILVETWHGLPDRFVGVSLDEWQRL